MITPPLSGADDLGARPLSDDPDLRYCQRAEAYARRVVIGAEVAGKLEIAACARFLRDLDRTDTEDFPYRLDIAAAGRACQFVELLKHTKGKWARPQIVDGQIYLPTIVLEDWQCFVLVNLFGWLHVVTGLRRFRRMYLEVARKNAKSTLAAGIALYMLVADNEPGAHVFAAATTGDQARLVFDDARNMAKKDRSFRERFGVLVGVHDITAPDSVSTMRCLNAEASTQDGLNIHCAIIDELHAHKTRKLFDVLNDATGARDQPLIVMITTAGTDRAGVCYEQRTYTVKLLQGLEGFQDESWFGLIYTLDGVGEKGGDDWQDPRNWRKANPNLGVSVHFDDLERAARKAAALPSSQANFFTKRLNVWVHSDQAWMPPSEWERCARPGLVLADVDHLPCVIGLDLASKIDIVAKARLFYDADALTYFLVCRFYLPERALEASSNAQYDGWRRDGWLTVTDGEVSDFDLIESEIEDDLGILQVVAVGYDPWQAAQMANSLKGKGAPMVEVPQRVATLSEPMKLLQALVLQQTPGAPRLVHDGNPVLAWMVSNVVCHLDAKENVYPRKERPENKIDGAVAAIIAMNRWVAEAPPVSLDVDDVIYVG